MPSPSTISVSVRLHSSSSRCRSALERASRETSRPNTAPTSPQHTRPTSSLNPDRADPPRPDTPRSASITNTRSAGQPSRSASSVSAYWRSVDSPWSRTCASVDWRT